jgi:hypothetical protein
MKNWKNIIEGLYWRFGEIGEIGELLWITPSYCMKKMETCKRLIPVVQLYIFHICLPGKLERATGVEPATFSLGS